MLVESPANSTALLNAELKKLSLYLRAWQMVNLKDNQMLSFIVTSFPSDTTHYEYLNITKELPRVGAKSLHLER
jgi:hypothetical protein